jgi:hypothetical protein
MDEASRPVTQAEINFFSQCDTGSSKLSYPTIVDIQLMRRFTIISSSDSIVYKV